MGDARGRWKGLREVALFVAAYLVYFGVRAITESDIGEAIANAAAIARLERLLGINWETALQSTILGHAALVRAANWIYIFGHWPLLLICGVVLYRYRRAQYYLLRNACLLSGAVGLAIFALFPVAPPRLAHLDVVDTVTRYARGYRTVLPPSLVNEYAAMPSFHAGWNVLLGIVIFRSTRRLALRGFAIAMPALMVAAILATANHFVLDAVVGTAIVLVAVVVLDHHDRRQRGRTLDTNAPGGRRPVLERSHRSRGVRGRAPRGERSGAAPSLSRRRRVGHRS